ncbi:MAG: hypothetical protein HZA90_17540 [Verrucomicrobia bacterium]|nr:hypothetical protein [Verrucomicrobiota bacterium]
MMTNPQSAMPHLALLLLAGLLASSRTTAQDNQPAYAVVARGPHHRVWQRTEERKLPNGRTIEEKHAYTELASGMHYWENGQWQESQEVIELLADGAAAMKGPMKVIFAPNLNTRGAITLFTPLNQRMTLHVLGLAYHDVASQKSVLIAKVKDCAGELTPPNSVTYSDAFDGLKADVRFVYQRSGTEQFVTLRQMPPSPDQFGLDPATTRLEVWTEFLDAPVPTRTTRILKTLDQAGPLGRGPEPLLSDDHISFGASAFGPGTAFVEDVGAEGGGLEKDSIPVGKTWHQAADGRQFLIEAVEYPALKAKLETLGLQAAAPAKNRTAAVVPGRAFPAPPQQAKAQTPGKRMRMAKVPASKDLAFVSRSPGFVLDWQQLVTTTNLTLRGDTTYFLSGTCNLYGNTTIEGGCVIKSTNGTSVRININGTLDCRTTPYRPAVFTGKDDASIGEIITGCTSNLVGYYGYIGLCFYATATNFFSVHDLRFIRPDCAVLGDTGLTLDLANLQFLHCNVALRPCTTDYTMRNLLFSQCTSAFFNSSSVTNTLEHATFHYVTNLFYAGTGSLNLTNALLVGVSNYTNYAGQAVYMLPATSNVFQTVGAGRYYLADNSPFRDAGRTNLTAATLKIIQQGTTYPPLIRTNKVTTSTTLPQVAGRDLSGPDIGWHYPSVDYLMSWYAASNASTLTLEAGVAVAAFENTGIWLQDGSTLVCEGTALQRNQFLRYNAVQEATTNWGVNTWATLTIHPYHFSNAPPTARFRFTDFNAMSGETYHLVSYIDYPWDFVTCSLQHSALYGAGLSVAAPSTMTLAVTNTLFQRTCANIEANLHLYFFNNLCRKSASWTFWPGATNNFLFRDNVFDETEILGDTVDQSHTAYISSSGSFYPLTPTNGTEILLTSFTYAAGPLGDFYQVTTNLLNAGSRNATNAGLYHFTTTTNQVKEGTSQVDRGLHYVAATNIAGVWVPMDTDGDGIPDYSEDRSGDGQLTPALSETDWHTYTTITNQPAFLQVFTPLK